jgi:hypothetical protein
MMKDVSPDLVTGIYRTFAFDRLQSAIKTTGDVVIPFGPTSYYSLRDNLIPQSPRFNRNGELVPEASKVKLMPESKPKATKLDSDYMKTVESGDVDAQQRVVDKAAKAAGYEKRWNFSENVGIDQNRGAFYTTSSKAAADSWGEGRSGQTRPVFILAKARAIEGKNILSSSFMTPEMASKLKSAGFDSASGGRDWKRGDEIAVFSPNQIKSADPVTYDNFGNVIPLSKRFDMGSGDIRYMPQGKPKATRLASELAKRSKVPLSKVQGSGAGGAITPNDIRAYINEQEGKFKPLAFQKEPPMAVDPTISDLVGSEIEFQGRVGTIVDDGGRPVLQDTDGAVYELPFGYFTDQSSRQLGVRPTGKRVVDKNNLIKEFEETSRQELRDIFGYIDDMTDKIVDLAELGNSVKRSKNRKSEIVRETPEFQQYVRGVTDQQILQAWDRTEKALSRAKQSKNINNEDIKAIIDKLEGDIRNIEKLAEAIDVLKQQRISRPSTGQEATTAVSGTSQADLMSQMEAEARAAGAKRRASSIGEPSRRLATPSISESYRRTGKEYRNPALARSISLAISGQSQERDQNK